LVRSGVQGHAQHGKDNSAGGVLLRAVFFAILLLAGPASSAPDEVFGLVVHTCDGDTVDVKVLNCTDERVAKNETIRVRFADIDSPERFTEAGKEATAYTFGWLNGTYIFLDLDDRRGMDKYGRWIAIVYLVNYSCCSPPAPWYNFNRQLVDVGFAEVVDYRDNEFDPDDWWEVADPRLDPPIKRWGACGCGGAPKFSELNLSEILPGPIE
jgi:endonuclease YncB( thermonuclease family)